MTRNGNVIIAGNKKVPEHREIIVVMDSDGSRLSWHEKDKNKKSLFERPMSITAQCKQREYFYCRYTQSGCAREC